MLILQKETRDVLEIIVLMGWTLMLPSLAVQMGILGHDRFCRVLVENLWHGSFQERFPLTSIFYFCCGFGWKWYVKLIFLFDRNSFHSIAIQEASIWTLHQMANDSHTSFLLLWYKFIIEYCKDNLGSWRLSFFSGKFDQGEFA